MYVSESLQLFSEISLPRANVLLAAGDFFWVENAKMSSLRSQGLILCKLT